ncbi:Fur family transcriptional regulator [Peptoniphilus equinus]|uniref:Fur family transcriptional regulator n=1 Tax=Peptoniphilus equinus TaxID=3016343 RepID=A0ABY7QSB9_9FIRM|nr:Fur family transcriptional regulator [Peptoniphilus equinus]WBW49685.1 Fur family transcriptional regulator [Peptoniphilus equinus]
MENLLIEHGLKATKGRMEVLRALQTATVPQSAEDLIEHIDSKVVSASSVYRILSELEHAGVVNKTVRQNAIATYDLTHNHQHFILCSHCGKMIPTDHCPIESFEKEVARKTGFKVTGHMVELVGICPNCQQALADQSRSHLCT